MPDLHRAQGDLGVFAAMIGVALADFQLAAFALLSRVTAIVAPRQSGKSRSLAVLALWWAYRQPGQRVLIVSAGEEASRRLLAEVRRMLAASPVLAGSVVDETAGLVTLTNGSEIRSVPASERQIRGWPVDLLLVDEAALISDDLWAAAQPTTAARPDARIVLASSANAAAGFFFDHITLGDHGSEHVRAFRWALEDCWWISPSAVAAARESMSPARWAAEYGNVFARGGSLMFSPADIDGVTADYRPDSLGSMVGPGAVWAGVDWGFSRDRSALVALGRPVLEVGAPRVLAVRCAFAWAPGYPVVAEGGGPSVLNEIAASPARFESLWVDGTGPQTAIAQMFVPMMRKRSQEVGGGARRPRLVMIEEDVSDAPRRPQRPRQANAGGPVVPTVIRAPSSSQAMKAAMFGALYGLVQRGRLLIPASATELIRELRLLEVGLTPGGGETFEASTGHDDLVDALGLALLPNRTRDGRWRTRAADVVDMPDPVPVRLSPGAWSGGRAVTGGGLEVPALPTWASPNGGAVTVPQEVADWRPPLDPVVAETARRISLIVNRKVEVCDG